MAVTVGRVLLLLPSMPATAGVGVPNAANMSPPYGCFLLVRMCYFCCPASMFFTAKTPQPSLTDQRTFTDPIIGVGNAADNDKPHHGK
ncbi:hypothetical protein [Oryza sativa Japonica Group]|uniref:Secreted protein n=1 Tax=Oryza sativa subsp. japonica TaxID=39947 RepID=Q5JNL4_ORYSJ|nr:hypothetical protein [Oryza sativa Japonica Group]